VYQLTRARIMLRLAKFILKRGFLGFKEYYFGFYQLSLL